jgi:hypothetical protein
MSAYIPFPGEQSLMPPGTFSDTRFFYFFLKADPGRLQALCDRYFGGRIPYRALGTVALAFTHVEELVGAEPERGRITYKDIAFWVPVWHERLCLFPPFIYVDEAATMVTGREVFGLPKQMGRFKMPVHIDELPHTSAPEFSADVRGTLQACGPVNWRRLVEVRRHPTVAGPAGAFVGQIFDKIVDQFHDDSGKPGITPPTGPTTLRSVGFKQLRDAAEPTRACYQSIVEAELETVKVHGGQPLLDDFDVTLFDVPSHPVASELGLVAGTQRATHAFYLNATMRMQPGHEIWRGP